MSAMPEVVVAPIELSLDEARMLRVFLDADGPLGARLGARELARLGSRLSEATVSRLFGRLDERGLTIPVGRKGRVLTAEGRRAAENALLSERTSTGLTIALDVREIHQLIDFLRVRRGLEQEAVVLAAERATEEDLAELAANIEESDELFRHGDRDYGLSNQFHRMLMVAAHSPLLSAMADIVLSKRLDELSEILVAISSDTQSGRAGVSEHRLLLDALRRRDGQAARSVLIDHLSRLIDQVEEVERKDDARMLERLLSRRW